MNKDRNSCPHGVYCSSVKIDNTADKVVYEIMVSTKVAKFKAKKETRKCEWGWGGL